MKKGFTLIELLAVIAILAIILLIAIPYVIGVINDIRLTSVITNEEMLIKATKNYLATEEAIIPTNIGETSEITIEELKNNGYISTIMNTKEIKDCSGYVLIKKTIDSLEYTPHLNCENELITNSTADGLIAHYKFNNNLLNYSVNNYNPTNYGASYNTNRFNETNSTLSFNGSTNYVDLDYGAALNPATNPHSFSMWVKPNAISPNSMFISSGQEGNSNNRLYLGISGSRWDMGIRTSAWGTGTITATTNWTHIVLVMNGTSAILYANGNISRTIAYSSYQLNRNLYLGVHDSNYWFNGLIDDFKIYSRALSVSEIKNIYEIELKRSR